MSPTRPGNRLRRLRNYRELSMVALAGRVSVCERTIARWESGETPIPEKHWQELADFFGVTVAHLLGLDEGGAA